MTFTPIRPPWVGKRKTKAVPQADAYVVAHLRPVSEAEALRQISKRFVVGEDGQFFEVLRQRPDNRPRDGSDAQSPVATSKLYRVVDHVKKRAGVGRGWIDFDVVHFFDALPALDEAAEEARVAALAPQYQINADYSADLATRIRGILDAFDLTPTERGWRELSAVAAEEADRVGIEVPKSRERMAWRTYALWIILHLARLEPKIIEKSFRLLRAEPPDLREARIGESVARDRFVEEAKEEARAEGVPDPKPYDQLLDELLDGGYLSDRSPGEEWRLPGDPPEQPPRDYRYHDRDHVEWDKRALRKREGIVRSGGDKSIRDRAINSLKAAHQERLRNGRTLTRGMIEAIHYSQILIDLNSVALRMEGRARGSKKKTA